MDMKLIVGMILFLAILCLGYSIYYAITTKVRNDAKTRTNEKIFMAKMIQRENALDEKYNEPNYTPVNHNMDAYIPREDIQSHGLSNAYALSQKVDGGITVNVNDEPVEVHAPVTHRGGRPLYNDDINDEIPQEAPTGKKFKDFIHD